MDNFSFNGGSQSRVTGVPDYFIEEFMPQAAGEFVKIYIYLLKCAGENCKELSVSRIADVFNNTEKDTVRALKYWERKGLLELTFDGNILTSLSLKDRPADGPIAVEPKKKAEPAPKAIETEKEAPADTKEIRSEKRQRSKAEIEKFSEQEDIPQLLYVIQKYLGKSLSGADINTIMFIKDVSLLTA